MTLVPSVLSVGVQVNWLSTGLPVAGRAGLMAEPGGRPMPCRFTTSPASLSVARTPNVTVVPGATWYRYPLVGVML